MNVSSVGRFYGQNLIRALGTFTERQNNIGFNYPLLSFRKINYNCYNIEKAINDIEKLPAKCTKKITPYEKMVEKWIEDGNVPMGY